MAQVPDPEILTAAMRQALPSGPTGDSDLPGCEISGRRVW